MDTTYLHADDGINEEEHRDEQTHVRQSLERLDECPQQDADGVALTQQLDEPGRSEQSQEADLHVIFFLYVTIIIGLEGSFAWR